MTGHRIRRLAYQDRGIAALDRFLEVAAIKSRIIADRCPLRQGLTSS